MKLKSKSFFRLAAEQQKVAKDLSKIAWVNMAAFSLVLFVGIAYIGQVNFASTLGYEIKGIESGIDELVVQNEQLEYQIAELQSVDNVTHRVKMLGMVPVGNTTYLSAGGASAVAVNR